MLHSVTVKNPAKLPVSWWASAEGLRNRKVFKFKPGLNILWGRNGSGKSTLLALLAKIFHAEQGGYSCVTMTSCRQLVDLNFRKGVPQWRNGFAVKHDGKPVFYANPAKAIGLDGGGFDEAFMLQGLANSLHKGSAGETTVHRVREALEKFNRGTREIEYRNEVGVNSYWDEVFAGIRKILAANAPKGPFTIILDEPDRSLDLDWSLRLWEQEIPKIAEKFQVLVATHSVLAIDVPGANYIELTPGYRESVRDLFSRRNLDTKGGHG
jgi:predicted ATPase